MHKQLPNRDILASGSDAVSADVSMKDDSSRNRDGVSEDTLLIRRCLAGEIGAWEQLYECFHHGIVSSTHALLGPGQHDPNLVEEIAARVWYSIIADNGKILAQYNPNRGARLITFFRLRARNEIGRMFRSERRRLQRELAAYNEKPDLITRESGELTVLLRDFLSTLSPAERRFCEGNLLAAVPGQRSLMDSDDSTEISEAPSTSAAYRTARQVREKLFSYLGYAP